MAIWTPDLQGRQGPKYLQIVDALAEDVASGVLQPGVRLPPHRELAYALGVSANTTSRAYAEGIARALIQGEVGRGTFVRASSGDGIDTDPADMRRPLSGPVDLSRNLPSPGLAAAHLAEALGTLGRSPRLRALVDYQTEADLAHHADAAIEWVRRSGVAADSDEVVVTNGAQHGILCALMAVAKPGDLLLAEALTYPPVKAMAYRLGLKLKSVARDDDGLCPDALEDVCRTHGVRALYLSPTLHTPTTTTLMGERRARIAEIAQRHDVFLIEDDVFGQLKPDAPDPIAALAPERTLYVTSTSKCLAPGLRVGFVRAPGDYADTVRGAVNLSCWMTPPLMVEVAATWIKDGTADRLTALQRETATRRHGMARAILGERQIRADPFGLHLWLELPSHWSADALKAEARYRGVEIVEGAAFAVDSDARPNAVRLCLSHEPDEQRLTSGLEILRDTIDAPPTRSALVL